MGDLGNAVEHVWLLSKYCLAALCIRRLEHMSWRALCQGNNTLTRAQDWAALVKHMLHVSQAHFIPAFHVHEDSTLIEVCVANDAVMFVGNSDLLKTAQSASHTADALAQDRTGSKSAGQRGGEARLPDAALAADHDVFPLLPRRQLLEAALCVRDFQLLRLQGVVGLLASRWGP